MTTLADAPLAARPLERPRLFSVLATLQLLDAAAWLAVLLWMTTWSRWDDADLLIAATAIVMIVIHCAAAGALRTESPRAIPLQVLTAVAGLVRVPFGTAQSIFVLTAVRRGASERWQQSAIKWIVGFWIAWQATALVVLVIPNALTTMQRSRVMTTMRDMYTIHRALQAHAETHGSYPRGTGIEAVIAVLPEEAVPAKDDGWGRGYFYWSDGTSYCIASPGRDGRFAQPPMSYPAATVFHDPGVDVDLVLCEDGFRSAPSSHDHETDD